MKIVQCSDPLSHPKVIAFLQGLRAGEMTGTGQSAVGDVRGIVAGVIQRVRDGGDAALCELEQTLDGVFLTPDALRVPEKRILRSHEEVDPAFLQLIRGARRNIRQYQEAILWRDPSVVERDGRSLSLRYGPLDRVAVYVPGGRAFYPSTVLMTVIPAQVAGVSEIVMASPPTSQGEIHPEVLALAAELGLKEIYRLGGAVAIAALAWGTSSIRPVDKIVGPGNAFVAEAKRQVFGRVGIDMIAGPSEVLIVADETANPDWVAADLLAQAEHDPGSAILITTDRELAHRVGRHLNRRMRILDRMDALALAVEKYCMAIVVPDLEVAYRVANAFAPEHLQIWVRDEEQALASIRHAGAIFLGPHTPVPVGDYYAGPSHVLPTGSTARFSGPLSCNDFLKATSVVRYGEANLREDGPRIMALAQKEGLTAHAESIKVRLDGLNE